MSTIKSSSDHIVINADGASKDIKFQANGVEKASISSAGAFTSTTIDATVLTGDLPVISGANLTGLSGGNAPYVSAYNTSNQTLTAGWATLTLNQEANDSDGAWNTGTYKFTVPSGKAGKYFITFSGIMKTGANAVYLNANYVQVRKNSSVYVSNMQGGGSGASMGVESCPITQSWIIDLAVGDTIDVQGYCAISSGSGQYIQMPTLNIMKIG